MLLMPTPHSALYLTFTSTLSPTLGNRVGDEARFSRPFSERLHELLQALQMSQYRTFGYMTLSLYLSASGFQCHCRVNRCQSVSDHSGTQLQ